MRDGIVIIALGNEDLENATRLLDSLAQHYHGAVHLITDDAAWASAQRQLFNAPSWTLVPSITSPWEARRYKVALADWSPFDLTVYLDADLEVRHPLEPLFAVPEDYLMLGLSPRHFLESFREEYPEILGHIQAPLWAPRWDSAVFSFRKSFNVNVFFALWQRQWRAFGQRHDEPALFSALYLCHGVQPLALDGRWNCPFDQPFIRHFTPETTNPS